MTQNNGNEKRSRGRKLLIALAIVILFAYATQVTKINLQEPLQPRRQSNLISLLRELARPDLFAYETETRSTDISIRMPCPEEVKGSQVNIESRQLLLIPNCVTTTQDGLTLQGTGFTPNASILFRWYPLAATSTRRLTNFKADAQGQFSVDFTMPDVRPSEEPQRLEVVETLERRIVGPSDTTILALDKIVETVLMALLASTIGTLLAIPISFLAARNLMRDVRLPLAAIMGGLVLMPLGAVGGWWMATRLVQLAALAGANVLMGVWALAVSGVLTGKSIRLNPALTPEQEAAQSPLAAAFWVAAPVVLGLLTLASLAQVGQMTGAWLGDRLGPFDFIGNFVLVVSDLLNLLIPATVGLIGLMLGAVFGARYGQEAILRLPETPARIMTAVTSAIGTSIFVIGLGLALFSSNLMGNGAHVPATMSGQLDLLALPAAIITLIVALLALFRPAKQPTAIGMATYTVTRGILNLLRSIEPIMMGFVFVAWVGLGPFAGILALTLHSVADLGKLFSEQVENIEEGPREAVRATGANTVQSIVFAVVPQITLHYIAYIFYRWDINVRMSTIIGFVGGGGIGFVLQRLLNQLRYTEASVMVIAIAVIVSVLDYASSLVRRRIT